MHKVIAVLMIVGTAAAQAQVKATQGPTQSEQVQEQRFESPMILELPFPATDPSKWGKGQIRGQRIGTFICEGVSFRDFSVSVKRTRGGKVNVTYHLVLANEPGVDKLAMIRLALVRDGETIDERIVPWSQVEEGRISVRSAAVVLPADQLSLEPPLQLRITVSVKNDA